MGQGIQQALLFLVQTLFSLYAIAIILRIMMRAVHADYYNPLVYAVDRVTYYPIHWLRKIIPDIQKVETASVVYLWIVLFIKALFVLILNGLLPHILPSIIWAVGNALALLLQVIFYLVIIQAILSWVPAVQMNIQGLIAQLAEPYLAPARRIIPLVGGLDLSPLAVLIVLQLMIILIANPIMHTAFKLLA